MKSNYLDTSFADRLRQMRKRAHLTQTTLSKILGVHRISIIRWESGIRKPSIDVLLAYVTACNGSLSEVVDR